MPAGFKNAMFNKEKMFCEPCQGGPFAMCWWAPVELENKKNPSICVPIRLAAQAD